MTCARIAALPSVMALSVIALLGTALLGTALLGQCRAATPQGLTLRDDLSHDVTFVHSPQRIITLLPSLTETVCALDACDRLVATDRYSNWPAQAQALPKAGGLDDAAVELIVSLQPDLVLLSRSQRITDRLRDLGVRTFALNTQTYADIGRSIGVIGRILAVPDRAATLGRRIDAAVRDVATQVAARHHGEPTVYFEVDRAPYAAGPESFIGELLVKLGTRNIVTADLGPYPKLNPEYVVRHNPDVVIFVSQSEAPRLAERPGWDQIRAVREHRVCSYRAEVADTIVRPGPRVPDGMRALADCLARVAP